MPFEPSADCAGDLAAACIPGGDVPTNDCFGEFRLPAPLPDALPPPRVKCVDGDPTCDSDAVPGQCTFRVGLCLNNADARLPCTPRPITSVVFAGRQARSAGGARLLQDIATLGAGSGATLTARGVVFTGLLTELNQCTPLGEFVVRRKRKRASGTLRVVVATQDAGRDLDRLKLVCLAP